MNEATKSLIDLIKDHSDLPIVAMVDSDVVADKSCAYWLGDFKNVRLGEYTILNDHFIDDREEFKEEYYGYKSEELCEKFKYNPRICEFTVKNNCFTQDQYNENIKNEKCLDEYLDIIAEKVFKPAIIVYIDSLEDYEDAKDILKNY